MYYIYTVVLSFTSDVGVDVVLVRLSLIKYIIKYVNLMSISFSVKNPQTFWESSMNLFNVIRIISNMYAYPFNPQFVIKI